MRIIAHLDMDAFFAAVEERNRPHLKGKPIVVGSDPQEGRGRGVVSTANYKAREYGIRSAMPISKAWILSEEARKSGKPEAIFITPGFGNYGEVSNNIFNIVELILESASPSKFSGEKLERASIDEAYVDLSFAEHYEKAAGIANEIKRKIFEKEKLTCSIGIGPNKLIAKIAVEMNKPDGLTVIKDSEVAAFLRPLSIRKIPGIGPKSETELNNAGIKTIGDLQRLSEAELIKLFGKSGGSLYRKAHGIDDSPIVEEHEVKSVGEQTTFDRDTLDFSQVNSKMEMMCRNTLRQMIGDGFKTFRTVAITVRFKGFETKTRAHTLKLPASDEKTLIFEAIKLLMPFFDHRENPDKKLIRLIGVRIEKLEQAKLF